MEQARNVQQNTVQGKGGWKQATQRIGCIARAGWATSAGREGSIHRVLNAMDTPRF